MRPIIQLYREARRRKVFRTAALYLLGSWAVLQVADVLFPGFGIPETAIQALVWAAALGFPAAVVFGWLFEIGPDGIRRTRPLSAGEVARPQSLGRRDYALLAAFVAVAAVLVFRAVQDVRQTPVVAASDVPATAGGEVARLSDSVAVLPFTNISSDPENEYFCDGISEEILNQISTVRGLNVIGRTSSFAFKGSNVGIDKISAVLGVRYVLQGSVRKAGQSLRISAQLLDERGRQLWAQTFDRELANVFEIQEEIARTVAARVAREVDPIPEPARRPSLEAYDRYLAGRERLHNRDALGAMAELQHAIDLDPGFAEAGAEWAIARLIGFPSKAEFDSAAAAIDRALELKPQLLRAQAARALWLLQSTSPDPAAAESLLRDVLEQDPNMSDAWLWLANALLAQDRPDEAIEILQRAARIDPLHPSIAGNLAMSLAERGDDEGALRLLERQLQQPDPSFAIYAVLRDFYRVRGRLVELNALAKDAALRTHDSYFLLAESYASLGDYATAEHWIERSARDYPDWLLSPYQSAIVPNWRGDVEEARDRFERGLKAAGVRAEDQSAVVSVWYGSLLARSGRYAAAVELLEQQVVGDPEAQLLRTDIGAQHDGWHALAWSYQHTGGEAKAGSILSALLNQCRSWLDNGKDRAYSDSLHYCAETALLAGEVDRALVLLERAVEAGWRDYYLRGNDTYWASIADDPRYRAIMARVKADLDRQRTEVERVDATDGFMAALASHQERKRVRP